MAYRKHLLIMAACLMLCQFCRAQTITFQEADSTSRAQYQAGNWAALVQYGQRAVNAKADFPQLRQRMAYAYFTLGNYSAALQQYTKVLAEDSQNSTARFYSYLCNVYVNRNMAGWYHLSYIDSATLAQEQLKPFALVQAAVETGIKLPQITNRGTGIYSRVGLAARLGWHLQLDQSVAYFGQDVQYLLTNNAASNRVNQAEYYAKLNWQPLTNLTVWGAYHYLNTSYQLQTYNSPIGLLGIKLIQPYFEVQADASRGTVTGNTVQQYNAQLYLVPFGQLTFYTLSRGTVLRQNAASNFIFSQLAGFRVSTKTWLEAATTIGNQNNYLEADGLYVYNAVDQIEFKAGSTGYYQLNKNVLLYLNYTYEQKKEYYQNITYNQHAITGGLTWKF